MLGGILMEKKIEQPILVNIGELEEITGGGGNNNDDGSGQSWSTMASNISLGK